MTDQEFFHFYIPALKEAMNSPHSIEFSSIGPDWFITDPQILQELEIFEKENYTKFKLLFDLVGKYMDLKSHNFNLNNSFELRKIHENLLKELNILEERHIISE